jgi:putative DNA methylase
MSDSRNLIEDYLPVEPLSAAASSEPRTKGHISTMHVWRARRPLVACRAAVYGALVPASQFVPGNGPEDKKQSLGRANAAKFVTELCRYPGSPNVIKKAQKHILAAHASRLTSELAEAVRLGSWPVWVKEFNWPKDKQKVTEADIEAAKAPRPKVLDMFAGGGAIPIEAARLGCTSHALELNPVAYIIGLCTVTFPQKFGQGLADGIETWGKTILKRTQKAVSDVIPRMPVARTESPSVQRRLTGVKELQEGYSIVAHYWTRTIPCPNPQCKGSVPLYRQTWLRNKSSGYVALKPVPDMGRRIVRFHVVEARSASALGFDPATGSAGSSTSCPFCQTALDGSYVRRYGDEKGYGQQLMCVIALNPDRPGKLYIVDDSIIDKEFKYQTISEQRAMQIERELGPSSLDEEIPPTGNAGLATGNSYLYGIRTFRQAFTPRQRYILLIMAREVRRAYEEMLAQGMETERAKAITTYLGLWVSRLTDRCNGLARWDNSRETIVSLTSMKRFAMMWDFPEVNLFGGATGDAWGSLEYITAAVRREGQFHNPAEVVRASATELPYEDSIFDAVITDPPYYDNESYSELSDVCYVWLRPTIGFLYPEHFAGQLTPKKKECVAAAYRQGGKQKARSYYENCMFEALREAHRVAKPHGILVILYAHKTTLGWATLVDALRRAGYEVTEAWPIETETTARVAHRGDAALVSSIFLVARKRQKAEAGGYEADVRSDLENIVSERVSTLWDQGITGADLVIACVGAGLRAFTRYGRVEYANGEEVPAEKFLAEVETVVLETILARLSKEVGGDGGGYSLAGVDPATRFYILWRYTYRAAELDAGEAIVFANGTHVELDGPGSLSHGVRALLEKKKGKYRLNDFKDRGKDEKLGLPEEDGSPSPLVDALHRTLWLMENRPRLLPTFLRESGVNREQMRLVAQALAGPSLKGGEIADVSPSSELAALSKLTANWRIVVEDAALTHDAREARRVGQQILEFEKEQKK